MYRGLSIKGHSRTDIFKDKFVISKITIDIPKKKSRIIKAEYDDVQF